MKIACIGWGSLVWNPLGLKIEKEWHKDGPLLPIEFTRISRDDRVTLIIDKEAKLVRTFWALMTTNSIEDARRSLQKREDTPQLNSIHFIVVDDAPQNKIEKSIHEWLLEKKLNGAIWTGLSYSKKTNNLRPSIDDIINHLKKLTGQTFEMAKEYITKAPKQIDTEYRLEIEKIFRWKKERR